MGENLFYVSRADIFQIYPRVLKELLIKDDLLQSQLEPGKNMILLPSDLEWQLKIYFRLLEQQRKINSAVESGAIASLDELRELADELIWDPLTDYSIIPFSSTSPTQNPPDIIKKPFCNQVHDMKVPSEILWNLKDFSNAGKLMQKTPSPVRFYDEYEMRKVYSLIYDVFRYKLVLNKTLNSIEFFKYFPELVPDASRVWLLLFDLYLRKFTKRPPELIKLKNQLYNEADLIYIESCLNEMKIKLAASITKIRIERQALDLQSLLPAHLRDDKVAKVVTNPVISGWISRFKNLNKRKTQEKLYSYGFTEIVDEEDDNGNIISKPLKPNTFKFDKLCPHFLEIYPLDKSEFSQKDFCSGHELILMHKVFAVGVAVFSNLLDYFEINGDVLQTHILSPRSTSYLASLLRSNRRVGKLRVYGAGNQIKKYQSYFDEIGVDNVILHEESFLEITKNPAILERTIAILCTPPSSYSGILDPIDLICSRGGDLTMLQFLSESEMTDDGKKLVLKTLEEQREVLKSAMGRPQIQIILYETHSIVQTENEDMVENAIHFMNKKAKEKHIYKAIKENERLIQQANAEASFGGPPSSVVRDQQAQNPPKKAKANMTKLKTAFQFKAINTELDEVAKISPVVEIISESEDHLTIHVPAPTPENMENEEVINIIVPQTDLFETMNIPDFCENKDNCINDKNNTVCFLSLIRRKEIVRMDSKYLIKIAELRGIFGKDQPKRVKSKAQMRAEKKMEFREQQRVLDSQKNYKPKGNNIDKIIDRLLKPTQSTIIRITRDDIWRNNFHIRSLIFSQFYPPKCLRCDRGNQYFMSDKCVTLSQFDEAFSLRFEDTNYYPVKRRAFKWWIDTLSYLRRLKYLDLTGVISFDKVDNFDKSVIPPLKLLRFPRGYLAPKIKGRNKPLEKRVVYTMSVAYLNIQEDKSPEESPNGFRRREIRLKSARTIRNYNKCYLCIHELRKFNQLHFI